LYWDATVEPMSANFLLTKDNKYESLLD
jgi:hypothetical protein